MMGPFFPFFLFRKGTIIWERQHFSGPCVCCSADKCRHSGMWIIWGRQLSSISNLTPQHHGVSLFQQKSMDMKGTLRACVCVFQWVRWRGGGLFRLPLHNLGECPMRSLHSPSLHCAVQPCLADLTDRQIRVLIPGCCHCSHLPSPRAHTHSPNTHTQNHLAHNKNKQDKHLCKDIYKDFLLHD